MEVLSGGLLSIEDTGLTIAGSTYGLKVSSGADVQLAGGTFTGGTAAIQADNFDALLVPGCVYFDASGNPLSTADLATAKTVTVKFQPTLSWDDTSLTKDYNGEPVKETDLPAVHITARESDDLSGLLQYSYREKGATDFTPGLPTDAGTYEIKASLPQQETYRAAETDHQSAVGARNCAHGHIADLQRRRPAAGHGGRNAGRHGDRICPGPKRPLFYGYPHRRHGRQL